MATLQSMLVRLGLDSDDFRGGLTRARKSLGQFRDNLVENRRGIEDFGNALASVGRVSSFSSLAAGAVSLTSAVVPAAGALLMLPGAAAAGGAAMGTLNVATAGFGEAMDSMQDPAKFAEAIGKLAPEAAATATAIQGLTDEWDGLTRAVQNTAFAGMSAEVTALGGLYLPVLQAGMSGVATEFNHGAHAIADWLAQAETVADVESIFASTRTAVGNLVDTAAPLAQIFTDVAAVGAKVFADLTSGAGAAAQKLADFVAAARASGDLESWMRGGVEVLGQLGEMVGNVGGGLFGMLQAANPSGQRLLDTLVQLTAQFEAWATSVEGQQEMAALFDVLGQVLEHLLVILPMIAGALTTVTGWISALPGPVQSVVTGFLAWSLVIGTLIARFSPLLSLLTTLAPSLGKIAGKVAVSAVTIVAKVTWWTVTTVAKITWWTVTTLAKITWWTVTTVAKVAAMAVKVLARVAVMSAQVIARFTVMAAQAVARVTAMGATIAARFVAMAAVAIARTVATAAVVVAQWVIMAAGAMARAVIMAAAWFVALGPVGWVIAIIVGLVALIIANWDRVKGWTIAAWNAVVGFLVGAWNRIVSAVSGGISRVGSFIRGLPGQILGWLGDLGSLLWDAGRSIIQGLIDGLMSAVGWLKDKLSWVTGLIPDWKGPISVDARLLEPTGRVIMGGLVAGIDAGSTDVEHRLADVTSAIARTPAPAGRPSSPTDDSATLGRLLERAVRAGMENTELVMDDRAGRLIARTVNRVNAWDARR